MITSLYGTQKVSYYIVDIHMPAMTFIAKLCIANCDIEKNDILLNQIINMSKHLILCLIITQIGKIMKALAME